MPTFLTVVRSMNRLFPNSANRSPALWLGVAVALGAWFWSGVQEAAASCGDYVKIANPQFAQAGSHADSASEHSAAHVPAKEAPHPAAPCHGPECGGKAPVAPLPPVPLVVRVLVEQWAVAFGAAGQESLLSSAPLCERAPHLAAGHRSQIKRPPRG